MGAAAIPIIAVVASAIGTGVEMNQAKQAQKGSANAAKDEQNQVNQQIDLQKKTDASNLNQQQQNATSSQKSAIDAIRAAMSANSGAGGTILTSPQGAAGAPIQTKSLLGI